MARAKNVPNDPQRRERIIAATMRILQEEGVTGVRARAVAARAEVPLSSVSYHFPSVRELLLEASRRVAALRTEGLRSWSDRKSTRLNSSHVAISYAVFCLKKKKKKIKKNR